MLRGGRLVALPTETVYGLAARALEAGAVARIFAAKGRPTHHPLIVHVLDERGANGSSPRPGLRASALARAFWPGPLTLVVERAPHVGAAVAGGGDSIALRAPSHAVARAVTRGAKRRWPRPAPAGIRGCRRPRRRTSSNNWGPPSTSCSTRGRCRRRDRVDGGRRARRDGSRSSAGRALAGRAAGRGGARAFWRRRLDVGGLERAARIARNGLAALRASCPPACWRRRARARRGRARAAELTAAGASARRSLVTRAWTETKRDRPVESLCARSLPSDPEGYAPPRPLRRPPRARRRGRRRDRRRGGARRRGVVGGGGPAAASRRGGE